jgi:glutamate dehydrogenase (NADP+)
VKCDVAFPCATQNELKHADAMALVNAGCQVVIEGRYALLSSESICESLSFAQRKRSY